MQVTQTHAEGLKRQFEIVLSAQDLTTRMDSQLGEMQQKARIKGFRPGKVPVAHLKRMYGRSIMAEVLQEAVSEARTKMIEDSVNLVASGVPRPTRRQWSTAPAVEQSRAYSLSCPCIVRR